MYLCVPKMYLKTFPAHKQLYKRQLVHIKSLLCNVYMKLNYSKLFKNVKQKFRSASRQHQRETFIEIYIFVRTEHIQKLQLASPERIQKIYCTCATYRLITHMRETLQTNASLTHMHAQGNTIKLQPSSHMYSTFSIYMYMSYVKCQKYIMAGALVSPWRGGGGCDNEQNAEQVLGADRTTYKIYALYACVHCINI